TRRQCAHIPHATSLAQGLLLAQRREPAVLQRNVLNHFKGSDTTRSSLDEDAPSAARMPISRRRNATEYANTPYIPTATSSTATAENVLILQMLQDVGQVLHRGSRVPGPDYRFTI